MRGSGFRAWLWRLAPVVVLCAAALSAAILWIRTRPAPLPPPAPPVFVPPAKLIDPSALRAMTYQGRLQGTEHSEWLVVDIRDIADDGKQTSFRYTISSRLSRLDGQGTASANGDLSMGPLTGVLTELSPAVLSARSTRLSGGRPTWSITLRSDN